MVSIKIGCNTCNQIIDETNEVPKSILTVPIEKFSSVQDAINGMLIKEDIELDTAALENARKDAQKAEHFHNGSYSSYRKEEFLSMGEILFIQLLPFKRIMEMDQLITSDAH